MKTNYHSPYAKVRFGGVGFKLAFLTSYDPVEDCYFGHCCTTHWKKALSGPSWPEFYKTKRKFTKDQVLYTWRNLPMIKTFKKATSSGNINLH